MGEVVLLIRTEIVFDIGCLGYRRVHAASEENGVKQIVVNLASLLYCINVGRMDQVVIQY